MDFYFTISGSGAPANSFKLTNITSTTKVGDLKTQIMNFLKKIKFSGNGFDNLDDFYVHGLRLGKLYAQFGDNSDNTTLDAWFENSKKQNQKLSKDFEGKSIEDIITLGNKPRYGIHVTLRKLGQ